MRLVLLISLALVGVAHGAPPFCADAPEAGAKPDFSGLVKLGEPAAPTAQGAWTWVNLWASWCEPCTDELPRLLAWQAKLGGPAKVRLVLVSLDDDLAAARKAMALAGVKGAWHAPQAVRAAFTRSLGLLGGSLPTHVLIDPQGKAVCVHEDMVEAAHFPAAAHRLGVPGATPTP
ncbi:MAG: TlpA family protein disulfide reductase [Myxococcales bacterium]|nr:TlpA family protein disulfide reductase [Myxococcales bacterium]MCB9524487.1 TlpA family protein disulfide reductase [Myxococcales bacterium]